MTLPTMVLTFSDGHREWRKCAVYHPLSYQNPTEAFHGSIPIYNSPHEAIEAGWRYIDGAWYCPEHAEARMIIGKTAMDCGVTKEELNALLNEFDLDGLINLVEATGQSLRYLLLQLRGR